MVDLSTVMISMVIYREITIVNATIKHSDFPQLCKHSTKGYTLLKKQYTLWEINISMEDCPVTRDLQLKMMIFHSHTSLPEGTIDRVLSFKALTVCFDYRDVGQSHIPKRRRKRHEIFREILTRVC